MARRDIVFPIEVIYACQIAKVDFLNWLRNFLTKRYGEKVSAEVYDIEIVWDETDKLHAAVLTLDGKITEQEMTKLELELMDLIYGFSSHLTKREKEILRRRVSGGSLQKIAKELGVKPQSVVTVLKDIKLKVAKWFTL
jgi:DNA-directed RNA polymerase specialized sigma24 family protein